MANFVGHWKVKGSQNFAEFLAANGMYCTHRKYVETILNVNDRILLNYFL